MQTASSCTPSSVHRKALWRLSCEPKKDLKGGLTDTNRFKTFKQNVHFSLLDKALKCPHFPWAKKGRKALYLVKQCNGKPHISIFSPRTEWFIFRVPPWMRLLKFLKVEQSAAIYAQAAPTSAYILSAFKISLSSVSFWLMTAGVSTRVNPFKYVVLAAAVHPGNPLSSVPQWESGTLCDSQGQKSYLQDPSSTERFSGSPVFTDQKSWVSGAIFVLNKETNVQNNTDREDHCPLPEGEAVVMFCWCLHVWVFLIICLFF